MKKMVWLLILTSVFAFYFIGCDNENHREGQLLAEKHCQTCHRFPEPELLDKKTWSNYVLPQMGLLMGFRRLHTGAYFEDGKLPETLPINGWNQIINYYLSQAPDSLNKPGNKKNIEIGLGHFEVFTNAFFVKNPSTTYLRILPEKSQIIFADGLSKYIYILSGRGGLLDSLETEKGVVHIQQEGTKLKTLAMGVLYPSDEKSGSLVNKDLLTRRSNIILDSLQRPVYVEYADLNGDAVEDIIICEFGNLSGQLSWFENFANKKYLKHILRPLPGAVRTKMIDADGDGKKDIVAMMAQGDEGIFIYYNKGNGQFEEKRLLKLPPSYGSNYFDLQDFNNDGLFDILATNGDNGDYPPLLKPYHGIRIYLNSGNNNFTKTVFLPMNGACKAIARDFDADGDIDIASISYFPDYANTPQESFLYWENKGSFSYQPISFNEAAIGRWLTMDADDIDLDGDVDIILGNAKFPLGNIPAKLMLKWNNYSPSILILKNKTMSK